MKVSMWYVLLKTVIILAALSAGARTKSSWSLQRQSFTPRSFSIFSFGRLNFPFKPEIQSVTSSFSSSFHLEKYLRLSCSFLPRSMDLKIMFSLAFQLILFGSLYFGLLETSFRSHCHVLSAFFVKLYQHTTPTRDIWNQTAFHTKRTFPCALAIEAMRQNSTWPLQR